MKRVISVFLLLIICLCACAPDTLSAPGDFIRSYNKTQLCQKISITDFMSVSDEKFIHYLCYLPALDGEYLLRLTSNDKKRRIGIMSLTYASPTLSAEAQAEYRTYALATVSALTRLGADEVAQILDTLCIKSGSMSFTEEKSASVDGYRFYFIPSEVGGSLTVEVARFVEETPTHKPETDIYSQVFHTSGQ